MRSTLTCFSVLTREALLVSVARPTACNRANEHSSKGIDVSAIVAARIPLWLACKLEYRIGVDGGLQFKCKFHWTSIQQRLDRCPRDRTAWSPGCCRATPFLCFSPIVTTNLCRRLRKLSVLSLCIFSLPPPTALLGRRGMEVLWPQSPARAGNRGMASRSQDFANEEKIGQQGAEMAGRVQVVDELRADRRLG